MVEQQDGNGESRLANEALAVYGHGRPLNPILINGVSSVAEVNSCRNHFFLHFLITVFFLLTIFTWCGHAAATNEVFV